MVQSHIQDVKFDIWTDVESQDKLFDLVESVLDENAETVNIWKVEFDDSVSNNNFHLEVFFDVESDGMFVGDAVAAELKEALGEYEEYPTVGFSEVDE